MPAALLAPPIAAAVGFPMIYLLCGGGISGALFIFLVAKIFRK